MNNKQIKFISIFIGLIFVFCFVACDDTITKKEPDDKVIMENKINFVKEAEGSSIYNVTVKEDGVYDIVFDMKRPGKKDEGYEDFIKTIWSMDKGYESSMLISMKEEEKILVCSIFLKKGEHELVFRNEEGALPQNFINAGCSVVKEDVYYKNRLILAENWMRELHEPKWHGFVEAKGWEDMWTSSQYCLDKYTYGTFFNKPDLIQAGKDCADNFLIELMLEPEGYVHTVYRARKKVFEESIENTMVKGVYELRRGNNAFISEMIFAYRQFGEQKYLDNAIKAADYILEKWPVNRIKGIKDPLYCSTTIKGSTVRSDQLGRFIVPMCQLYLITKDQKWLDAAISQGEGVLYSQYKDKKAKTFGLFSDGIFPDGNVDKWLVVTAYTDGMLSLSWLYGVTNDEKYKQALEDGLTGVSNIWSDDYGYPDILNYIDVTYNKQTGYGNFCTGGLAQCLITAGHFTGDTDYYRWGERIMSYAFGRNKAGRDTQNPKNGSYGYFYNYTGASNIEASSEMNLALQMPAILNSWRTYLNK